MKAEPTSPARPVVTAFVIWFAHFVLCWTAAEIWPDNARANQLAWGFTGLALLAVGMHVARQVPRDTRSGDVESTWLIARGAAAVASVAILFTAVPSVVWLP